MRRPGWTGLVWAVGLAASLVGCAPLPFTPAGRRLDYLAGAQDQGATYDAILSAWGPPQRAAPLTDGRVVWVYEYAGVDVYQGTGGSSCARYLLTFGAEGRLEGYRRQVC